jgi:hypothetical protein
MNGGCVKRVARSRFLLSKGALHAAAQELAAVQRGWCRLLGLLVVLIWLPTLLTLQLSEEPTPRGVETWLLQAVADVSPNVDTVNRRIAIMSFITITEPLPRQAPERAHRPTGLTDRRGADLVVLGALTVFLIQNGFQVATVDASPRASVLVLHDAGRFGSLRYLPGMVCLRGRVAEPGECTTTSSHTPTNPLLPH